MSDGTIKIGDQDLAASYLSPAALEYWRAWLAHEARMAHNPFREFAEKVQVLPPDLRVVATREFVAGVNFDVVPKVVLLDTLQSLPAVQMLCLLITGREDVITAENYSVAFPLLFPYIQRREIIADSLQEANRLRAEVGKPPIGKVHSAKPPSGQPAGGQPPHGG